MMRQPTMRGGFTLLEVVLAISLTVGLMGAVYMFYNTALRTRSQVMAKAQWATMERGLMDRTTDELRNAIVYPFLRIGMQGQQDQMQFMCTALPGPAAWAVRNATDDPIPPEHDIQMVGYRLRIYEDEDGLWHNDGLERTSQKLLSAPMAETGVQIATDLIGPEIHFLHLHYFDAGAPSEDEAWKHEWAGSDLPMAVEVILGATAMPEEMEVDDYLELYPTFRRTIFVPGGSKALSETFIKSAAAQ